MEFHMIIFLSNYIETIRIKYYHVHMNKKLLYLDVCCLCRPFDNQNYLRIKLETDAIFLILERIQKNDYDLLYSKVHLLEIEAINNNFERNELMTLLKKIGSYINPHNKSTLKMLADELHSKGIGIADAAHLSFAEIATDFFITCDDSLIKKGNKFSKIPLLNLVEFCIKENLT